MIPVRPVMKLHALATMEVIFSFLFFARSDVSIINTIIHEEK